MFDIESLLKESAASPAIDRNARFINPQFASVLRTIGFDVEFVKGEGAWLWDKSGNKYLDFLSGYGVFGLGRNHPVIRDALTKAMNMSLPSLLKMGSSHLPGLLAEKLVKKAPGDIDTVFFANSGAEAVESAMKFARAYTGRDSFVYLDHAYHGLTLGALSLNGCSAFRTGFGELPSSTCVSLGDLNKLEDALRTKRYAGVVFEPVQGKGVFFPKDDYWNKAQALCRKYGTLFIADEVQSGMGRTGKFFACEHWNLEPDIITISKTLSGGYVPVSAVLYPSRIYRKTFSSMDRSVVHSSTFSMIDLAMVAGLATLHVIEEEKLVERAAKMGDLFLQKLQPLVGKYDMLKEVRGKGLMIGFEFGSPKSLKLNIGWKLVHAADKGLFGQMIVIPLFAQHKILTQVAGHNMDVIKLLPPMVITEAEVNQFASAFEQVVAEAHKFPGAMWDIGTRLAKSALSEKLRGSAPAEASV